jgi:hypothetical protein
MATRGDARERMDASEPGTTTCFGSRNMDRQRLGEREKKERPVSDELSPFSLLIFWREKGISLQWFHSLYSRALYVGWVSVGHDIAARKRMFFTKLLTCNQFLCWDEEGLHICKEMRQKYQR